MPASIASAIAANRFGLGARPGELALIGGESHEWLRAQLRAPAPALSAPGLRSSAQILAQALELRRESRAQRKVQSAQHQRGPREGSSVNRHWVLQRRVQGAKQGRFPR